MADKIICRENVQRYYGDSRLTMVRYAEIEASGKCPFCDPNIENERVKDMDHWIAVKNKPPYENTLLHLLILPRRHIEDPLQMDLAEEAGFWDMIHFLRGRYPETNGCGLCLRGGEIGGITIRHLHWHLIVPEVGPDGRIPVVFGIG